MRHGPEGVLEGAGTLYVGMGHQVEEAGEQSVGGGVGPSEVEIQGEHHQLIQREGGAIIAPLGKGKDSC